MRHAVYPFHHSFINIGSCPQIHILRNGVPVPAGKTRTASRLFRISQQQHPVRPIGALLQPVRHKRSAQSIRMNIIFLRIP